MKDLEIKEKLKEKFRELFGECENARFFFAPGRVNLIELFGHFPIQYLFGNSLS